MRKCSICESKHFALGYCRKHHINFKRNGIPESLYDKSGYVALGGVRDSRPGSRGSLAVNIINEIKFKARKRNKAWELTHQQAFDLITAKCTYCKFKPEWPLARIGIDRKNNLIGYTSENCVSCCFTCNSAKGRLSIAEFKVWIRRIHRNHRNF